MGPFVFFRGSVGLKQCMSLISIHMHASRAHIASGARAVWRTAQLMSGPQSVNELMDVSMRNVEAVVWRSAKKKSSV